MDEMTLLRDLRSEIPAPAFTPEAEAAFAARIRAEAAGAPPAIHAAPARSSGRDLAWRLGELGGRHHWRFAVAAVMSIALAVGLITGLGRGAGPSAPAATGTPAPTGTPTPSGTPAPAVRPVSAVLLAELAAAAAAARPAVPGGQWVYTKTVTEDTTPATRTFACHLKDAQGRTRNVSIPVLGTSSLRAGTSCTVWSSGMIQAGGGETMVGNSSAGKPRVTGRGTVAVTSVPAGTHDRTSEQWTTADSTRQASYSASGKLVVSAACPCGLVSYANLAKLPTDPKALVKWAMRTPGGGGHYTTADLAWNAFNGIEGTLMGYVLPPRVAAELYRALGDIPGVTVDQNAVDAAGRHGPAFVLTDPDYAGGGWTAEIFLNPHTYQLTGYADRFPARCQCPSPGASGTAIVRQAFVSGPGVRP